MGKTWIYNYYYVDVETGEFITRAEAEENYIKKKYSEKAKYNGKYNIREIIYVCRRSGKQLRLI